MSGYEEFQMIMAEIEMKKKNINNPDKDKETLEYLKNLFGI